VVEKGFRAGDISILAATSTLAAGVNLPAGRVLVRSMQVGREALGVMQYKQMCGRAGRMGQGGDVGESFLLVKASEKARALQLCSSPMPDVLSQLHPRLDGGNALLKAVVEAVGLGLCASTAEAEQFVRQTLLFRQAQRGAHGGSEKELLATARSILDFLLAARILDTASITATGSSASGGDALNVLHAQDAFPLKITRLGKAILHSNVNPDEALVMYESLLRAQDGLHLESSLHLLFLVTPLDHAIQPNFRRLLGMYEASRSAKNQGLAKIFDAVGVEHAALSRWQASPPTKGMLDLCSSAVKLHCMVAQDGAAGRGAGASGNYRHVKREEWQALSRCKRLWVAIVLQGVLEGRPLAVVSKEFGLEEAEVETLLQGAQIMSSKVVRFCEQVGWSAMQRMLSEFRAALQLGRGDSPELAALLRVPHMPRKVAQVLAGHAATRSVEAFAEAPTGTVAQLLQLSIGFELQVGPQFLRYCFLSASILTLCDLYVNRRS
jgi:hypothetical protein